MFTLDVNNQKSRDNFIQDLIEKVPEASELLRDLQDFIDELEQANDQIKTI